MPFEIPKSWVWCHLDDCCQIVGRIGFRGYTKEDLVSEGQGAITLSPSNIVNGRMDYSKCTYISWGKYEESPEIKVNNGDILLVKTGSSYGKCAFVESLFEKATINPQFVVLRHISINPEFLTLILQSQYARKCYNEFVIGTAIPTFTQEKLSNMFIPLPPIYEQNRIISQVSKLMVLISHIAEESLFLFKNIEHVKSKILELAITGKLVPQNPDDEPAAELLRRINPEAQIVTDNGHYKNLPSGWFVTKLPDICSKIVDGDHNPPKSQDLPTPYAMLSASNIDKDKIINLTNVRYLSKKDYDESNKRTLLQKGDLLLTTVGSIGRSCILMDNRNYALQRSVTVISSPLNVNYLKIFIDSPITQRFLKENARGTAQKGFYLNQFDNLEIPIPPQEEQKRIVSKIQEFYPLLSSIKEALQV